MATYEKSWQFSINYKSDTTSTTTIAKNSLWYMKAFLKGDLPIRKLTAAASGDNTPHPEVADTTQDNLLQGLWTCYYSCDGTNVGTAGDGIDRWGTQGGTTLQLGGNAGSTNSGSTASITTGATIAGAVRLTGVANMTTADVGNFITITDAATAANNSPTDTPFKIVQYNSATSVDIYNPNAVAGDANNGSISWTERNAYSRPTSFSTLVNSTGAHSWMVLKSPAALGPYYIILDYNNNTNTIANFVFSKSAPTGGTTSARPTATDEVTIAAWQTLQFVNTAGNGFWNGMLSTDGNFMIIGSRGNGQAYVEVAWIFQVPADTKSADNYKAVMYLKGAGGVSALTTAFLQTTTNWSARNYNGTGLLSGLLALAPRAVSGTYLMSDLAIADAFDGQYDEMPVYLFNNSASAYTLKGRFYDIKYAPTSIPTGFTSPSPSSVDSIVLGDFWFPSNLNILT